MTRAAEFCYIPEMRDGRYVQAIAGPMDIIWTKDPEMAIRCTAAGRDNIKRVINSIGFRKVLVG